VCKKWNDVIIDENRKSNWIWKSLVEKKVKNDPNWKEMAERQGWIKYLFKQKKLKADSYYRSLFRQAKRDIPRINSNCISESGSTEELLQVTMDDGPRWEKIVVVEVSDNNIFVGTSAGNIRIMNRKAPIEWNTVTAHTRSIHALQGRFL